MHALPLPWIFKPAHAVTFQIKVLGPTSGLSGDFGVYLDRVQVVGVPGDHDIVPVVVIERLVGVPLYEMGTISQV